MDRLLPVLVIALWILGKSQLREPLDPDAQMFREEVVGAFMIFAAWIGCVYGAGCVALRAIGITRLTPSGAFGLSLALGSAWLVLPMVVAGYAGGLSWEARPYWEAYALSGPLVLAWLARRQVAGAASVPEPCESRTDRATSWLIASGLLVSVGFLLLYASVPRFVSDSMAYHMTAPRVWMEQGGSWLTPRLPHLYQSGYWEYLMLWSQLLLGGPVGKGLIESALFMQWSDVFLGIAGSMALCSQIFSRYPVSRAWQSAAVLAATSSPLLRLFAGGGKNDWGAIFWFLAGAAIFLQASGVTRKRDWLLAGGLFGLSFGAKYTVALALGPFLGLALLETWRREERTALPRDAGWLAVAGVLATSPLLARNFWYTGNPFFTVLNDFFGNPWRPLGYRQWSTLLETGRGAFSWLTSAAMRMQMLVRTEPGSVLAPFVAIPLLIWPGEDRRRWLYLLGPATYLILLSSFALPTQDPRLGGDLTLFLRFAGPGSVLGQGFSVLAIGTILARIPCRSSALRGGVVGLGLCLTVAGFGRLAASGPPRYLESIAMWNEVGDRIPLTLQVSQPGGGAKAWLRQNARLGDLVVTTGDYDLYFVSYLRVTSVPAQPFLEREVARTLATPRFALLDSARFLRGIGVRYLMDVCSTAAMHVGKTRADCPPVSALGAVVQVHEALLARAVRYYGRDAVIVDVQEWADEAGQACQAVLEPSGEAGVQALLL